MKNVIGKEEFISFMEDLQKANDYQIGLNKYFKANDVDGYIYQPDCSCSVMKLLHIVFGESDSNEWISYFCFDLNFGRKWKEGTIKLENAADLYELLTKNNQ